ncbi:MAG TPA: LuxR C-terminal-related transcriptional regulator [Marinobacter sp.]|nr:LuxR C-terminal-related transcriptional regulator [Marinobacter sp.]
MGQWVKSFKDGRAANDEFQTANSGLQQGELIRGLLEQRLRVPGLADSHLERPELNHVIRGALKPGHLLFLEAPGGYGKTHALAAALTRPEPTAVRWISLTSGDNAPSRFLSLLATALGVPENGNGSGGSFDDHLGMLLMARSRCAPPDSEVLILDNLQYITNPAVIGLLHHLVCQMPYNLSIAMASRQPLIFETHTLELKGRYTRLGVDHLEFSRTETFEFFRQAQADRLLTSVAIDSLYSVSEGWPTPLALYRQELGRGGQRQLLPETPSVERFLRESVLRGLTSPQLVSLRVMAELDICSDELFEALAPSVSEPGMPPSVAAEKGLPVKAVPGRGRWYRVNPLLQAWLRNPVMGGYATRMLLASRWYGQRIQFPEALKYALLAGDTGEILRIASEGTEALLLGQDTASLLTMRKHLPSRLLEQSARLRIVYAWVHAIGGQFRQARQLLESFSQEDWQQQEARVLALKAFILRGEGFVDPALAMADRALISGGLSPQAELITQIVRSSALCAAGDFSQARDANRRASKLAREAGDSGSEALAVYAHARIELGKGALRHAEQLLRTGLDTAMQELTRPARIGETRMQLNLVLVLWHQGRLGEADRLLVHCTRHAEQTRDLGLLLAMALRVLMCRAQGRLDDAFVWIGRAERTMHAWQVDDALYLPVLEALKGSCWLSSGQVDSAAQALEKLEPYRRCGYVPELFPMMPGLLDCLRVRIDLANGDQVRARANLEALRNHSEFFLPRGLQLHTELLDAVLLQSEKGANAARKAFEAVVLKAAPEHFISPFAELRNELLPIVERCYRDLPDGEFKRSLGKLFDCIEPVPAKGEGLAESISDREQSVLELIAQGLSNQEIADSLHISLHTVKTHARRINAKLEVKSRTQAIVRARELGLL